MRVSFKAICIPLYSLYNDKKGYIQIFFAHDNISSLADPLQRNPEVVSLANFLSETKMLNLGWRPAFASKRTLFFAKKRD